MNNDFFSGPFQQAQQTQMTAPPASGGDSLLTKLYKGVVGSPARFINQGEQERQQVINTAKGAIAQLTGNQKALSNALEAQRKGYQNFKTTGGLLNMGTITNQQTAQTGNAPTAIKQIGGNLLQNEAMLVPGAGSGSGILAHILAGAGQGAAFGAGGALEQNQNAGDITKSALGGAATGGVIGGGAGVLGKLTGGAKGLVEAGTEKAAAKQGVQDLAKAYEPYIGVPKNAREATNLTNVIDLFKNRLGMDTSPQSLKTAAGLTTGENGAFSGIMRELTQSHQSPINVNGFMGTVEDAINTNSPILGEAKVTGQGNSLYKNFTNLMQNKLFKGEGSLTGTTNAENAFNTIQEIDKQIARYGKSGAGTPGEAIANVYKQAKGFLEDRLYNDAGFNKTVASKTLDPTEETTIRNLVGKQGGSQQLADYIVNGINGAGSASELRSLQQPFVQASQLADAANKTAAGSIPKDVIASGSTNPRNLFYQAREASSVLSGNPIMGIPLLATAAPGVLERAGGALQRGGEAVVGAGEKVGGAVPGGTGNLLQTLLTKGAATPEPQQTGGQSQALAQPTPATTGGTPSMMSGGFGGGAGAGMGLGAPQAQASPFSAENVQRAILNDIAQTGGKNTATLISLYNTFGKPSTSTAGTVKPSAQQVGAAQSGVSSLSQLEGMLQQQPDVLSRTAVPGGGLPIVGGLVNRLTGTGQYKAAANNTLDALARLRTGAAMTKSEGKFYQSLLPQAGDSQQTVAYKLQQLEAALTPYASQQIGNNQIDTQQLQQLLGAQQ